MTIATYSPGDINIIIRQPKLGVVYKVDGFTDTGTVDFAREVDSFTMYTSVDNRHTRVFNKNTSGTATFHLAQTSDSNDVLQGLYDTDVKSVEGGGQGYPIEVLIQDNNGRSFMFSQYAYFGKPADSNYTNNVEERQWTLYMPNCETYVGGNMNFSGAAAAALEAMGVAIDPDWL